MASNTPVLNLYKKDPATDGNETFNIKTMLNENWDKIDADAAKPFYLKSAIYDSTNDKIDLTFGPGRAAFLGTLVAKDQDSTYSISAPAVSTSYYIYIKNDGTYTHNTTGEEVTGAVQIWKVTTGATVDQITTEDLRGQLPGAAARKVQDNLDEHKAETAPHGATSEVAADRLMLRDANGRVKVAQPVEKNNALNITDFFEAAYPTADGGSAISNVALANIGNYLLTTHTSSSANNATRGLYLIVRHGTGTWVETIIADPDVTVSVDANYYVVVTNSSAADRGLRNTLIRLM